LIRPFLVATTKGHESPVMGLAPCLAEDIEPMRKLAQNLDLGLEAAMEQIEL
jgi:hypothetical protein